jgi:DTW domain-containing protein YfiP
VVVLQHPQEQDRSLGSAPLLTAGLANCDVRVGLSWRNLADALGQDQAPLRPWAVLYPASLPKGGRAAVLDGGGHLHGAYLMNARGRVLPAWPALGGILLLDGTWSQAKALWWRNPWLLKLPRLGFAAPPQSIYGRVRKEPKPGYLSTLEAATAALDALGEDPAVGAGLRRAFRTLVQRLRDAHDGGRPARRAAPPRGRRPAPQTGGMTPSMNDDTQSM